MTVQEEKIAAESGHETGKGLSLFSFLGLSNMKLLAEERFGRLQPGKTCLIWIS